MGSPLAAAKPFPASPPWYLLAPAALFLGANAWYLRRMMLSEKRFSLYAGRLYDLDTLLFPAALAASAPALGGRGARAAVAVAGLCVAARIYATHIEPKILRVRRVRLRTPKLGRPVRILHITDMETDAVRRQEPKVIGRARDLRPDLVFHTGDLLAPVEPATYESELPKMAAVWAELEPPLGKICVLGEVDLPIRERLGKGVGGLKSLDGRSKRISGDGFCLNVLGLTLEQSCNRDPDELRESVREWLAESRPGDFTILAGHRPDFILAVKDLPVDLCLAGHAHGGQVRIPGYGPLKTHSQVPDEWSAGFHEIGRTRLNVSAGVGFEHGNRFPAVRFNCPPEMTLLDLIPEGE